MLVARRRAGYDGQGHYHAQRSSHEHLPSAKNVVKSSATDGEDPARDGVYGVQEEFRVSVVDANSFDEKGEILEMLLVERSFMKVITGY